VVSESDVTTLRKHGPPLPRAHQLRHLPDAAGDGVCDVALVPAPWMKKTKGIRGVAEWYMATVMHRDYVRNASFEVQCEYALKSIDCWPRVGDRVQVVFVSRSVM